MTNSPLKNIPSLSHPSNASADHQLRSPKSNRGLRKLQSAHQLSTNYAASNTPSLISQQRLLHQQQQQQRTLSTSQNNSGTQGHPSSAVSSHHRTRSNSDAVLPNVIANAPISKRNIAAKKTAVPQLPHDELESMVRQGPRGDVPTSLQRLRYLVLIDGLPADGDGMVKY